MFSKGTAQPVVSAVTQVTKATIYYKSENYTRKFNNAKTAGLWDDVPPFHFFLERELEKSLRNLPHPCLPPPPSLPPLFFLPVCIQPPPPPVYCVFLPFFRCFQKKWKQEVAKAHWFLQSRRTIIIVAYVERVL